MQENRLFATLATRNSAPTQRHVKSTDMKLTVTAAIQIQKPAETVFENIVNPEKLTRYFIAESSGPLEQGRDVVWKWPEFPDRAPVTGVELTPNRSISFVWDPETRVSIALDSQSDGSTVVRVSEGEKDLNDENLKWFAGNTEGWANFLACLKAFAEHGINLRSGAFDFLRPV